MASLYSAIALVIEGASICVLLYFCNFLFYAFLPCYFCFLEMGRTVPFPLLDDLGGPQLPKGI